MPDKADIVRQARAWIGTPWRHQGRVPRVGLDCAGLIIKVAHELQLSTYDFTAYQRHAQWSLFVDFFRAHGREIDIRAARPGDILIMRQERFPCHCAIVGDDGAELSIIHAYALRRAVVEERLTGEWLARRVAAFVFPGVD